VKSLMWASVGECLVHILTLPGGLVDPQYQTFFNNFKKNNAMNLKVSAIIF